MQGFFLREKRTATAPPTLPGLQNWREPVPKGYSKGTAIDFILKHFGLELDDAYVFGDSSNDLAMFTYGKHTVALGHHDPVLDPYTEYVTDTVENDGLMKAMAHYGLI